MTDGGQSSDATAYGGWGYVEAEETEPTETVENHPESRFIRDVTIRFTEDAEEAVIISTVKEVTDAIIYHDAVEFVKAVTYQGEDEYGTPKHLHHDSLPGATASKKIVSFTGTVAVEDLGEVAEAITDTRR